MSLSWQESIFNVLKSSGIELVAYVPDAGHSLLIEKSRSDPAIEDVVLTTEEEGVALCTGAWLGGTRSTLLMHAQNIAEYVIYMIHGRDIRHITIEEAKQEIGAS